MKVKKEKKKLILNKISIADIGNDIYKIGDTQRKIQGGMVESYFKDGETCPTKVDPPCPITIIEP